MNPSLNADIRDYQQYISGERIDGVFSAVALIGSVITLGTASVLPAIYEKAGLNEEMAVKLGYSADNVYDVLYNTELFVAISSVLIIASVIGATLNVIPLFFYDLTETKQKAMVNVLRIRAYFDDKITGIATSEQEAEVSEIIKTANEYVNKTLAKIEKGMPKQEKKRIREDKEKIEIAKIVLAELEFFKTSRGEFEFEYSKKILASQGEMDLTEEIAKINSLPDNTTEEKEFKRKMRSLIKDFRIAEKTKNSKEYKNAENFDSAIFTELFNTSDNISFSIKELQNKIKLSKEAKEDAKELKEKLSKLYKERKVNDEKIKQARKKSILYNRANKPIITAQKTLARYESYNSYINNLV